MHRSKTNSSLHRYQVVEVVPEDEYQLDLLRHLMMLRDEVHVTMLWRHRCTGIKSRSLMWYHLWKLFFDFPPTPFKQYCLSINNFELRELRALPFHCTYSWTSGSSLRHQGRKFTSWLNLNWMPSWSGRSSWKEWASASWTKTSSSKSSQQIFLQI